ncbi:glycosyltransferase family 32 protein [Gordonibacter massiliensis (ex Traore et al. 2017)]|uniref:glycosyltransferase family 32 protein n=1 Tax=Gordonibacter massiliensis (ex Traore et al. 2017) TaxID=1841863 RepID=UPI001C8C8E6F|nr:glycosyltransferase [Gordonibacter massiliensis (ex Traore et al. 2017)]
MTIVAMTNSHSIPKTIHYVWFGGNPLTPLAEKCVASWKEQCPDYEIIRWDESNFDVTQNRYCFEAYKSKKWAFVSDYARLKVLVDYGGIYMDADVEVLRSIDRFLFEEAFSGFETNTSIPTGIMACRKGFPLFKRLLDEYDERRFILPNGAFDTTPNTKYITNTCLDAGLVLNGRKQTIEGFALYPKDFFCPKSWHTGLIELTDNSYTIHHFSGSWHPEDRQEVELHQALARRFPRAPHKCIFVAANLALCIKERSLSPLFKKLKKRRGKGMGQ